MVRRSVMLKSPLPIVISRSVVIDFVSLQALPKLPSPSTSVPDPPAPEPQPQHQPQSPPTSPNEAVESPSVSSIHPSSVDAQSVSPFEYDGDSPTLGSNAQIRFKMAQVTEGDSQSPKTDNHQPPQIPTRLTVHQNQMESFESSFPADLVVPSQYKTSNYSSKALGEVDNSKTHTPTQADFPPRVTSRKPPPGAIKVVTGTVDASSSAQPDNSCPGSKDFGSAYAATFRQRTKPKGTENGKTRTNGNISVESSEVPSSRLDISKIDPDTFPRPFSFIHFADIPSDQLAIKTPVTPKGFKFRHNRIVSDQSYFQSPVGQDTEPDWEIPKKRPSGKRKPGSFPLTRPEGPSRNASSDSGRISQRSSSLRSHGSRRIGNAEGQRDSSPPADSQRRRWRSRPLSDALDGIDESPRPDSSTIPGLIARQRTNEPASPTRARKQKRGSLMNNFGSHPTVEEAPQENPPHIPVATSQSEPPQPQRPTPTRTDPVKHQRSKSKTLLLRPTSSSAKPEEASAAPEKAKKKRFSGLSVSQRCQLLYEGANSQQSLFSRSSQKQQPQVIKTPQSAFNRQPTVPTVYEEQTQRFQTRQVFPQQYAPPSQPEGPQREYYGNAQDEAIQPADPPAYDGPPLEGYYSPDRKDGKFPPDAMGGRQSHQGQSPQRTQQANPSSSFRGHGQNAPSPSRHRTREITPSPGFQAQNQQTNQVNMQGRKQTTTRSPNYRPDNPINRSPEPFSTSSRSKTQELRTSNLKSLGAEDDDTPPPPPPKDDKPGKAPKSHRSTLPARLPSQPDSQPASGQAALAASHQASRSISESSRSAADQAAQRVHQSPTQMTPTQMIQSQGSAQSKRKLPSSRDRRRISQAVGASPSSTRQEGPSQGPEEGQRHQDQLSSAQSTTNANASPPAYESVSKPDDRSRRNHHSLPLLQTSTSRVAESDSRATHSTALTQDELRRARREEIEKGISLDAAAKAKESEAPEVVRKVGDKVENGGTGGGKDDDEESEEEKIVMSSTSYPGQEWHPDYAAWED